MEKQAQLLTGHLFDDRYEIQDLVGIGGMGEVYRAYHVQLQKIVAIKIMRPELLTDARGLQRFKHEAQLAIGLKHHNIAQVQTFGIADNKAYMVMDLLQGESLQTVLERDTRLDFQRFCEIFLPVCEALEYAHSQGIIHRDLKPANIYIDKPGSSDERVVLVDFGIAKLLAPEGGEDQQAQKMTKTGAAIGTPNYMSPEQCRAEPLTLQSDIYSLGCVMYHAAYGKPPFSADSAYGVMMQHGYEDAPLDTVPGGYPGAVTKILAKAMAKSLAQRYGGITGLKDELLKLQQGSLLGGRINKSGNRRFLQMRQVLLVSMVALAVAALLGAFCASQYLATDAQLERLHAKHDFAQLKREVTLDTVINPERAASVVSAAVPDICESQSRDALETLALGIDVMQANKHLPQIDRIAQPARILLDNLPADVWREHWRRIIPAALEIRHYARSRNFSGDEDVVAAECELAGNATHDQNLPGALALARDALSRVGTHGKPESDKAYEGFLSLADILAPYDLDLCRDLLSVVARSPIPNYQLRAALAAGRLEDRAAQPDLALERWQRAYKLAQAAGKADDSFRALQSLAEDELLSKKNESGLKHMALVRSYLTQPNMPEQATARLVRLGEAYWYSGQKQQAQDCFKHALAIGPAECASLADRRKLALIPETEWAEGVAYALIGNRTKSSEAFENAARDETDSTKPIRFSVWSDVGESLPDTVVDQFGISCWAIQRETYIEAGKQLEKLAEAKSLSGKQRDICLFHAAVLLSAQNQLSDAIEDLTRLESSPFIQDRRADILSRIVDCRYRNGEFALARQACDRFWPDKKPVVAGDQPGEFARALVWLRTGQMILRDVQLESAEHPGYTEATKEQSRSAQTAFAIARAAGKRTQRQVEKFEAALGYLNATRELGDWEQANTALQQAIEQINPDAGPAMPNLNRASGSPRLPH